MRPINRIFVKLIEVIACLSCVITKALTDQEAKRIFILNHKLSREWSLLQNVTWSIAGNSFANVTYGGYTLITSLMAISRLIDARSHPTIIEKIFLTLGMFMFLIMGGIVLASIEQIPYDLIDNAIILGLLSFLVAFIFLIDLSDPLAMRRASTTQTATNSTSEIGTQSNNESQNSPTSNGMPHKNLQHQQIPQIHPNYKQRDLPQIPERRIPPSVPNTRPGQGIVQAETLPKQEQPVFANLLCPEKTRASKTKVNTKGAFIVEESRKGRYDDQNQGITDDDTMSRISANSYVKNTEVDEISTRSSSRGSNNDETNRECEEIKAATPGYVVHAAKMWDSRTKTFQPKTFGANTRV